MQKPADTLQKRPSIAVASDHALLRRGLELTIAEQPDIDLRHSVTSTEELEHAFSSDTAPDLSIVDVNLASRDRMQDIVRRQAVIVMQREHPSEDAHALAAYRETLWLSEGAKGVVHIGQSRKNVLAAIRHVLAGERYASAVAKMRVTAGHEYGKALTTRETEVYELTGKGKTTAEIAKELGCDVTTIQTYNERIKKKRGFQSRDELMVVSMYELAGPWPTRQGKELHSVRSIQQSTNGHPHTIALASGHPILLHALQVRLENEHSLKVVHAIHSAEELDRILSTANPPELIIIDVNLTLQYVARVARDHMVIVMDGESRAEDAMLQRELECLYMQARGYVRKEQDTDAVVAAIERTCEGKLFMSTPAKEFLLERCCGNERMPLTAWEEEIYACIGQGMTTRDIAKHLGVKTKDIDNAIVNMKRKLGIPSKEILREKAIRDRFSERTS